MSIIKDLYDQTGCDSQHPHSQLLLTAANLAQGSIEQTVARDYARRGLEIEPTWLAEVSESLQGMEGSDAREMYCLVDVLQAAAVANSSLSNRMSWGYSAASCAARAGKVYDCMSFLVEVMECLEICKRYYDSDPGSIDRAEESIVDFWRELGVGTDSPLDPSGAVGPNVIEHWLYVLAWNSDWDPGQGLICNIEASLRLVIHMKRWVDRIENKLDEVVDGVLFKYKDEVLPMTLRVLGHDSDDFANLQARHTVCLGDALMKVGEWKTAARILRLARAASSRPESDTTCVHASISEAYCQLMLDQPGKCHDILSSIDSETLRKYCDLFITSNGELARYLAVEDLYHRILRRDSNVNVVKEVGTSLRQLSMLHCDRPQNRKDYLRSLYFVSTLDEVNSVLSNGPNPQRMVAFRA